jgi:transposase
MGKEKGSNKQYGKDYKISVVQMLKEGKTVAELSRELDIHPNQLYAWKSKYDKQGEKAFIGKGNLTEATQMQRKIRNLEMEVEILKKALSIFSKDAVTEWSSSNPFVARTRSR